MTAEPAGVLTGAEILVRLGIALLLVLANGFFVAAEFSLVGARRTRIEALAEGGDRKAGMARTAIRRLDHYLSATQLGITLASLSLGWVGESTVAAILLQWFGGLPSPWSVIASHGVAIGVSFALITFLHIVLGELAPKSLALLFPESVGMWTAGPLIAFSKLFAPFILVLNGAANLLLRGLGLRAPSGVERVHRPEELRMLLTQTFEHGLMAGEPVEMIRGVFDLSETTAASVMTPRTRIVAVPIGAALEEVEEVVVRSGHSRIPVFEGSIDNVVGVLLARDYWRARRDRREASLADLLRPLPFVPENEDLERLLREMQLHASHLAVVIDEYGGTAGLVSVEDVLEEIVGEINDEHEVSAPDIQEEAGTGRVLVAGGTHVAEVNERFALHIPEEEFVTMAGFVTGQLGRLAREGDRVEIAGGDVLVLGMAGRRVERLALRLAAETDRRDPAAAG